MGWDPFLGHLLQTHLVALLAIENRRKRALFLGSCRMTLSFPCPIGWC
jgi:hypothetical protein